MRKIWPVAIVLVVVTACGVPAEEGSDGPTSTTAVVSSTTSSDQKPVVETPLPDETAAIEAAIADLSSRLRVPRADISVVEAKPVRWSDGSLGCPQDGYVYTQAIVDGSRVLLDADGRIFDYHADGRGNVVFCPSDEQDGGYELAPPIRPSG